MSRHANDQDQTNYEENQVQSSVLIKRRSTTTLYPYKSPLQFQHPILFIFPIQS